MRVVICGSRVFNDYDFLEKHCIEILSKEQYDNELSIDEIEIVSGNAKGADSLGERFSKKWLKKDATKFPAKWDDIETHPVFIKQNAYGKPMNALAGQNRNLEMSNYASENRQGICIAFPVKGEKNSGTSNMVRNAKNMGMKVYKIVYKKGD